MPVVLDRIALEDVERVWAFVEPHIVAACDAVTTELTPEFIHAEALADRRTLWAIIDTERPFPFLAVWVTGERLTNRGRVVFIEVCGGRDMQRWLQPCLAELEEQARAMGAVQIRIEGRCGWKPVLEKLGYRSTAVIMAKEL